MAWRSSGTTNAEMIEAMKRYRIISSLTVEEGFRKVDRKYFVPRNMVRLAHSDQPLRDNNVHISAPHIYGYVLEALELRPNASLTFLHAGVGTGYLACLAATILGPHSAQYGVEIFDDVVSHCHESIGNWLKESGDSIGTIDIFQGNALNVSKQTGEGSFGFDRIYIGAAIERSNLDHFTSMLKPGGILVGPVDDELVKIVRVDGDTLDEETLSVVHFSSLREEPVGGKPLVIPGQVWSPETHQCFPEAFRECSKELFLCANAPYHQPIVQLPSTPKTNVASLLPKALWMEVLTYTNRDWFKTEQSEIESLKAQLNDARVAAQKANEARLESDRKCQAAQRERDIFRMLAQLWQSRVMDDEGPVNESVVQQAIYRLASQGDSNLESSMQGLLMRLPRRGSNESDMEEDSDEDDDDSHSSANEDDHDAQVAAMDADGEVASMESESEDEEDPPSGLRGPRGHSSPRASSKASFVVMRPQVRTVSLSEND